MEYTYLGRYFDIKNESILPYEELKKLKPVWLTQSLELWDDAENIKHAKKLASQGVAVVNIRRKPGVESYADRQDFPRRIQFEVTSRCNFLCKMCPQQLLTRPRVDMPASHYNKIIDEIDSNGVEFLSLYHFGESLFHPEFQKILEHVNTKENLGYLWLSTNGEYLTNDMTNLILGSKVDYLNYSLHALSKENYEKIVSPKGKFDIIKRNLDYFSKLKQERGIGKTPYLRIQTIEQEDAMNDIEPIIHSYHKIAEIVSVNMLEHANINAQDKKMIKRSRRKFDSCNRIARNDCFINANGTVTLCDQTFNEEIVLGNVYKQSLYEIWNGAERQRLLRQNKEGKLAENDFCAGCLDYDL